MLISLIFFIAGSFPRKAIISIASFEKIKNYRDDSFHYKYIWSIIGGIFFLAGVLAMIVISIPLLSNGSDQDQLSTLQNPVYGYKISYPSYWVPAVSNFELVKLHIPGNMTGPELSIAVDDDISEGIHLVQYARYHGGLVQANSSTPSTLINQPAYTIQWSNDSASGIRTISIINDNGYIMDYTAPRLDFPIYLPIIKDIVESFELAQNNY